MEQEIPAHCGCTDIIVPPGNSWTRLHLFPVKSEEMFHGTPHQDADPWGWGVQGRDVLECSRLVDSLNIKLRISVEGHSVTPAH